MTDVKGNFGLLISTAYIFILYVVKHLLYCIKTCIHKSFSAVHIYLYTSSCSKVLSGLLKEVVPMFKERNYSVWQSFIFCRISLSDFLHFKEENYSVWQSFIFCRIFVRFPPFPFQNVEEFESKNNYMQIYLDFRSGNQNLGFRSEDLDILSSSTYLDFTVFLVLCEVKPPFPVTPERNTV